MANASIVTTGRGSLDLRIDTTTETIIYHLSYSDLEGRAATAAHIHIGSQGVHGVENEVSPLDKRDIMQRRGVLAKQLSLRR